MNTIETKIKPTARRITAAHAAELQALFAASPSPVICDRSAGNMLMWESELDTELVTVDGHVAVAEHCGRSLCFSPAAGAPVVVPTVRALLDAYGTPLRLCPIGEDEKAPLEAAFGSRIRFGANDGAADYIYNSAAKAITRRRTTSTHSYASTRTTALNRSRRKAKPRLPPFSTPTRQRTTTTAHRQRRRSRHAAASCRCSASCRWTPAC